MMPRSLLHKIKRERESSDIVRLNKDEGFKLLFPLMYL